MDKTNFHLKKSKFGKIRVLVFGNFSITQKWFNMFDICVEIFITCLYIIYNVRNYFCGFLEVLWDLLELFKTQFSDVDCLLPGSGGRPVGRPTCTTLCTLAWYLSRSTGCKSPTLGWGRSTRRSTVSKAWSAERSTSQRAIFSLDWHGRPGGRPAGSTVKNLTVGRSTGRSTGRPFLA